MKPKYSTDSPRHLARELTLKAIYHALVNPSGWKTILETMHEDEMYARIDVPFFTRLAEQALTRHLELDAEITPFLDRPLVELSPIEHAILRLSVSEMLWDVSVPCKVIINEGVELAKQYGGTDGYKYINGVLDKLALQKRPQEIT